MGVRRVGAIGLMLMSQILSAVEIAVTLDDYPLPKKGLFSIEERTESYCQAFEKASCKGVFFCIGSYCHRLSNPSCLDRLNGSGHFLGNHSFNHRHLSEMGLADFQQEVESTQALLSDFSQYRKWFRFPYLDYGMRTQMGGSKEKCVSAIDLLKRLGYQEGFVTINTFDWYLNACLQKAIEENKTIDYPKLKEVYLFLLSEWCSYYIDAYELLSKEIVHTLLLHDNDLNALFLGDILQMLNDNGWQIVSPDRAFNDPPWRQALFKNPEQIPEKPASLSTSSIDRLLEVHHVFQ